MPYATRNKRPPRTLTDDEVKRLLKVSGEHREGFRDHLILSFALGTGLRESEIVALDVDDVLNAETESPKRMIQLRVFKRGGGKADPKDQRVPVPDSLYYKLEKYLKQPGNDGGPLFRSRKGRSRLSPRAVRWLFKRWQTVAGFDHLHPFHALRHTAISNIQRIGRDLRVSQKFARHANINTTTIYEHASDEEVSRAAKKLPS